MPPAAVWLWPCLSFPDYVIITQSRLFKVVSFITGFKNSMKGLLSLVVALTHITVTDWYCVTHCRCFVQSRLFKVVSFITGFKNSMKGVGYFIGAASLMVHYYFALGILLLLILAAMPWAIVGLSNQLGRCAATATATASATTATATSQLRQL